MCKLSYVLIKASNRAFFTHKRQSYISHHRKAPHIKQKRPKSPRKRTVSGDVGRFSIFKSKSAKPGCGQGGDADGRNITRYAESAKGAASRASVPLLSYAHNTNQKGA